MSLKLDLESSIKKYNLNIKGVIHVGAHKGQEIPFYKKLNINDLMLFEPNPYAFQELKKNYDGEYLLFNVALGNSEEKVLMNIENVNDQKSSSILEPYKHMEYYPHILFTEKIEVEVTKLDKFLDFSDNFNTLVIDTQGYELEVLKGSENFLKRIDYIICEVNKEELYKDCPNVDDIDKYLITFGFKRFETSWSWDNGTWGDALYLKIN